MSKKRVRQHVNPFSFRGTVETPDWSAVLGDPSLPSEIDVGCAHGDIRMAWAKQRPHLNVIGLEIRKPMVERVNARIKREGLTNAHVVYCNANTCLTDLFPPGSLRTVYVHFPDPWFKKRHHKRRVMKPSFVADLATTLEPEGLLRFMTDFEEYAAEVAEFMTSQDPFEPVPFAELEPRPLTHRQEWHGERKGQKIHAYAWRRRADR